MSLKLSRPLPEALRPLGELALDLRWTWSHAGDTLWSRLDDELWQRTGNPWLMLQLVPTSRLNELAVDDAFLAEMEAQTRRRRAALSSPGWISER